MHLRSNCVINSSLSSQHLSVASSRNSSATSSENGGRVSTSVQSDSEEACTRVHDLERGLTTLVSESNFENRPLRTHHQLSLLLKMVLEYLDIAESPEQELLTNVHGCIASAIRSQVSAITQAEYSDRPMLSILDWAGETLKCVFSALAIEQQVALISHDALSQALQDSGQLCYQSLNHLYIALAPYRTGGEIRAVGCRASRDELDRSIIEHRDLQLARGTFSVSDECIAMSGLVACSEEPLWPGREQAAEVRLVGQADQRSMLLWQDQVLQSLDALLHTAFSLLNYNNEEVVWPLLAQLADVHSFCARIGGMLRQVSSLDDIVLFISTQDDRSALRLGFKDGSNVSRLSKQQALRANAEQLHRIFASVVGFVETHQGGFYGQLLLYRIGQSLDTLKDAVVEDRRSLEEALRTRKNAAIRDYFILAKMRMLSLKHAPEISVRGIFLSSISQWDVPETRTPTTEAAWKGWGCKEVALKKRDIFERLRAETVHDQKGLLKVYKCPPETIYGDASARQGLLGQLRRMERARGIPEELGLLYAENVPILFNRKTMSDAGEIVCLGRLLSRDDMPVVIKQLAANGTDLEAKIERSLHHLSLEERLVAPLLHLQRVGSQEAPKIQQIFKHCGEDLNTAYISKRAEFSAHQQRDIAIKVAWYLLRLVIVADKRGVVPDDIKEENCVLMDGIEGLSSPELAGLRAIDFDSWPMQAALELALTHTRSELAAAEELNNSMSAASQYSFKGAAHRMWSRSPHLWNASALRLGLAGVNTRSALYAAAMTIAQIISPEIYAFVSQLHHEYSLSNAVPDKKKPDHRSSFTGEYVSQRLWNREYQHVIKELQLLQDKRGIAEWGPLCGLLQRLLAPVEASLSADEAIEELKRAYPEVLEGFEFAIEATPLAPSLVEEVEVLDEVDSNSSLASRSDVWFPSGRFAKLLSSSLDEPCDDDDSLSDAAESTGMGVFSRRELESPNRYTPRLGGRQVVCLLPGQLPDELDNGSYSEHDGASSSSHVPVRSFASWHLMPRPDGAGNDDESFGMGLFDQHALQTEEIVHPRYLNRYAPGLGAGPVMDNDSQSDQDWVSAASSILELGGRDEGRRNAQGLGPAKHSASTKGCCVIL